MFLLGIFGLAERGAIPADAVNGMAVMGELSLDGKVRQTAGALPAAIAAKALDLGLICAREAGPEAAWAGTDSGILAPDSLIQLANHFKGTQVLSPPKPGPMKAVAEHPDLADVKGQETARRALEIAAAGGHNMLMVGPPGSGKSMLAAQLPGILPPLSPEEMLDVSMIQSVASMIEGGALTRERPFRAPHHSASMPAMVGGGQRALPGEASLAHHGVLFLDELPEFSATVLDSLRQPLETGDVRIARANAHVTYPAAFQLVAAMNPCRCGYGRASGRACGRGAHCEETYQAKISGPFLDRVDLTIQTMPVSALDLASAAPGEASAPVQQRVVAARMQQQARQGSHKVNARLSDADLNTLVALSDDAQKLLLRAAETLKLSARGYTRTLRVGRTIADLAASRQVERAHIAEAISYRSTPQMLGEHAFGQHTASNTTEIAEKRP